MKFKSLVLATVIGAIAVSGCGILNEKNKVHTFILLIALLRISKMHILTLN